MRYFLTFLMLAAGSAFTFAGNPSDSNDLSKLKGQFQAPTDIGIDKRLTLVRPQCFKLDRGVDFKDKGAPNSAYADWSKKEGKINLTYFDANVGVRNKKGKLEVVEAFTPFTWYKKGKPASELLSMKKLKVLNRGLRVLTKWQYFVFSPWYKKGWKDKGRGNWEVLEFDRTYYYHSVVYDKMFRIWVRFSREPDIRLCGYGVDGYY